MNDNNQIMDSTIFSKLSVHQLKEIEDRLNKLRRERRHKFILPQQRQHVKPLQDKYIKPLNKQYIKPINDTLTELRKYLPQNGQSYWEIDGKHYGPMTKREFQKLVKEIECDVKK